MATSGILYACTSMCCAFLNHTDSARYFGQRFPFSARQFCYFILFSDFVALLVLTVSYTVQIDSSAIDNRIAFLIFGFRSGLNLWHFHLLTLPARLAQLELDSECKCLGQESRFSTFSLMRSHTFNLTSVVNRTLAINFYCMKLNV